MSTPTTVTLPCAHPPKRRKLPNVIHIDITVPSFPTAAPPRPKWRPTGRAAHGHSHRRRRGSRRQHRGGRRRRCRGENGTSFRAKMARGLVLVEVAGMSTLVLTWWLRPRLLTLLLRWLLRDWVNTMRTSHLSLDLRSFGHLGASYLPAMSLPYPSRLCAFAETPEPDVFPRWPASSHAQRHEGPGQLPRG
eukprot:1392794-Amorphochlora_amoeboformis.AAC.1